MELGFCYLKIDDSCSLECKGCHCRKAGKTEKFYDKLPSISEWKKTVSSLRGAVGEGFFINFYGGSSLFTEGFFDLISYSNEIGFNTNITTNACLINEETAKKINDSGLKYLNIRLDSLDEGIHDRLRGAEGAYRKTMDAIGHLHRFCGNRLHKGINCVICEENLDNILDLAGWVIEDNRIEWVQFMAITSPANTAIEDLRYETQGCGFVWPKDIKKVNFVIDELMRLRRQGNKISNPVSQLQEIKFYYEDPENFINKSKCCFERAVQIDPAGDMFLCRRFERFGNIKEDDIKVAWHAERAEDARQKVLNCKNNCHFLLNRFFAKDGNPVYSGETNIERMVTGNHSELPALGASLNKIEVPKPGFCCFGITDRCMLKCKMCYKWQTAGIAEKAAPTVEQYKNFIAGFRELVDEGFLMNFGGGEALLFEGLLDLVSFCGKKGFTTNIASNGWLIDEEMARRIAGSGLTELNLSLDSLNENTHDYLRGTKGVYRRVMRAIEYLGKYCKHTKIGICAVIYDLNLEELMPLAEWVNNNSRINSIFFMAPMQPNSTALDREWWKGEYSFLFPKNLDKACLFIDKVLKLKATGHKIGNTIPELEAFKLYFRSPGRFVKKTKCNLDRAVHVSAMGDIFLCYRWSILGNCKNGDDIRRIWHSEEACKVRQNIAACRDNCHFLLNCFFEGDYPFGLD